jgi:hypothetical protein
MIKVAVKVFSCYCHNGGECFWTVEGASECACPKGTSGTLCESEDACRGDPCGVHGTCVPDNLGDDYACHCHKGYLGSTCDGFEDLCKKLKPCFKGMITI